MKTVEITQANFEENLKKGGILLLDFWASWCGPCRMFGPVFEAAAKKYPDIIFGKINTEDQQELAGSFGVRSIPTVAAFRDGILVFSQSGALPAELLDELIRKLQALDMNQVRETIAKERAKETGV